MRKRLSILAVLLLAVAISAYSVGGTYAKYTSAFTGTSSTARVAKWAFTLKDNNDASLLTDATTFNFNLFNTITEVDGTTAEEHVDTDGSGSEHVIAPGTGGKFTLKLANASEVTATYAITYTIENTAGIPIEFSIDNGTTWTTSLSNVSATNIAIDEEVPVAIQWRWAFTGADSTNYATGENAQTDVTDTALGTSAVTADQVISVDATITVTQVD